MSLEPLFRHSPLWLSRLHSAATAAVPSSGAEPGFVTGAPWCILKPALCSRRRRRVGGMGYTTAAILVLLAATFTGRGSPAAYRRVGQGLRKRHHETGSAILLQLGVIHMARLAFVFSETWNQYSVARQAISAECAGLHAGAMLAHGPDDRAGERFDRSVQATCVQ